MNLFLLDLCLKRLARFHCDQHLGKMVLELTQMLYTAFWVNHGVAPKTRTVKPYRMTHKNHPMTRWVRSCPDNWSYTLQAAQALASEFKSRRQKEHKCLAHLDELSILGFPDFVDGKGMDPVPEKLSKPTVFATREAPTQGSFPLAMPEECIVRDSEGHPLGVSSYRNFYRYKERDWLSRASKRKLTMRWSAVGGEVDRPWWMDGESSASAHPVNCRTGNILHTSDECTVDGEMWSTDSTVEVSVKTEVSAVVKTEVKTSHSAGGEGKKKKGQTNSDQEAGVSEPVKPRRSSRVRNLRANMQTRRGATTVSSTVTNEKPNLEVTGSKRSRNGPAGDSNGRRKRRSTRGEGSKM